MVWPIDHLRHSKTLTKSTLILVLSAFTLWTQNAAHVSAELLANRSITISSGLPSAVASHNYQFGYVTVGNVGSVVFEYCDNSPVFAYSCNAPAGLDVSGASLAGQTGNGGFSIDGANTTANKLVLTRPSAPILTVVSSYDFDNVTNPSTADFAVYVRISTYVSVDGSGPMTDYGAVAFATNSPLNVGAFVPPFIRLCVGITVSPSCSSISGNSVNLGNLRTTQAKAGQSQFAVGTNSPTGYVAYVTGLTMTSGNNTIKALTSPTPSSPGTSQFGMNLRANTSPAVGANPFGPGSASPTANYNIPNRFKFHSGDSIASDNLPTDFNRMTVSYMVNISFAQPPGVYSSTFTYIAAAQF